MPDFRLVAACEIIPGSYWGEREAGLMGSKIFARLTRPYIRAARGGPFHLHDAGAARPDWIPMRGDHAEENAVCYLKIHIGAVAAGTSARTHVPRYG